MSLFLSLVLHLQQSLQSGVSSHSPSVVSLNAAGEKLLASSTAEGSAEVQQDLANLNARSVQDGHK